MGFANYFNMTLYFFFRDMSNPSDDEDFDIPMIKIGNEKYPIGEVTQELVSRMTDEEKERYTQTFDEYYSGMFE